jgi:putative ABC transport system ATP-binding protein
VLRLSAVTKRFGGRSVLEAVSLEVAAGEYVAIVGDSGIGKSTLLNVVAGLEPVDSGVIFFEEQKITEMSDDALTLLRRERFGFVFQAFHVLPHLDVAQNVALPLMLLGEPDHERVTKMLDAVGLEGLGARLPQQLSGGQLQRVAIARALVHRPALLLADEPTGNLDPTTAARVMDVLIAQTREHGASLVLVTHSQAAATRADRVLQLTSGGVGEATRAPDAR